jgi:hypothetical protein
MMSPTREPERPPSPAPKEPKAKVAANDSTGAIELPVGRAFLVQLSRDCDLAGELVRGRVEHVRTGEATHFTSLSELSLFMFSVLRQLRDRSI